MLEAKCRWDKKKTLENSGTLSQREQYQSKVNVRKHNKEGEQRRYARWWKEKHSVGVGTVSLCGCAKSNSQKYYFFPHRRQQYTSSCFMSISLIVGPASSLP
uniref:Uncharacterized protein n=1 Tax=Trypanosoma congolense (strain IL3000) TaxID=1068625 RepID=G0UZ06_TRYCI|nr:hypothetical protein, unlikely [Trypanosoma congolense IL3000]